MVLPIKICKQLIKQKNIKKIGDGMFEVIGHLVKIQLRQGRILVTCDCQNSSFFGHANLCIHKLTAIIYLSENNFIERMDKLIEQYKKVEELKLPLSYERVIDDLESIRDLK